jgi:hypothetical protein
MRFFWKAFPFALVAILSILVGVINVFNLLSDNKVTPLGLSVADLRNLQLPLLLFALGTLITLTTVMWPSVAGIDKRLEQLTSSRLGGIEQFRPKRTGYLPPLADSLRNAKQDVLIVGIALGALEGGPEATGQFNDLIRRGCRLRFLMLSTYTADGIKNPIFSAVDRQTIYEGNWNLVKTRVEQLSKWRSRLAPRQQSRVLIKLYDNIPSTSAILIDAESGHGKIRVEPIIPGIASDNRPSFDVTHSSFSELYETLYEAYESLWKKAIPIEKIIEFHQGQSSQE